VLHDLFFFKNFWHLNTPSFSRAVDRDRDKARAPAALLQHPSQSRCSVGGSSQQAERRQGGTTPAGRPTVSSSCIWPRGASARPPLLGRLRTQQVRIQNSSNRIGLILTATGEDRARLICFSIPRDFRVRSLAARVHLGSISYGIPALRDANAVHGSTSHLKSLDPMLAPLVQAVGIRRAPRPLI
jgi:hypothetical protein